MEKHKPSFARSLKRHWKEMVQLSGSVSASCHLETIDRLCSHCPNWAFLLVEASAALIRAVSNSELTPSESLSVVEMIEGP
jgi:hypothetical protein